VKTEAEVYRNNLYILTDLQTKIQNIPPDITEGELQHMP
jgi:hypothetical protein